jgi:hypothetical protein
MKQLLKYSIGLMLGFCVSYTSANESNEQASNDNSSVTLHQQTPHVTMNIGFEVSGLEQAAHEAAKGLKLIGQSLHNLANNPDLTPEQRERMQQALTRVDGLSHSLTLTLEQIPNTIEKSASHIVKTSSELSDRINRIVIIGAVLLILIILAALAGAYYFVLAPGTKAVVGTAAELKHLAEALKITAEIVEKSSEQNLQVIAAIKEMKRPTVSGTKSALKKKEKGKDNTS